ncbi:hypothetical protein B0H13DRAFT_2196199 [Mycena leptocephala]|nr:hypothetical protein B0H13DRAFT_2196199 [Mycena leptocephala]
MSSPRSERKSMSSTRLPDLRSIATARSSVFSSVLPALRRSETMIDDMPTHHKSVLVTLKLSSTSFLDSVVKDDASRNPLYVIRTTGTSTSVLRSDPWDGLTKTAEIKWPKVIPTKGKTKETLGVLVQMSDGRWQTGDTILKPGTLLSAPPRFNIPNFPHTMKWKRMGNSYWCTTSSVKGPIATFHPAVAGVPPRIKVFETLHDKYDSRPVLVHNGVSILLLDHLIITAMLLVTDVQGWMLVQKYEADDTRSILPPLSASASSDLFDQPPQSAPASASQWRKVLFGEPIFPKRYTNSRSVSTTDLSAPIPTSMKQMAKIVYGDPIYPTSSPVTSMWDSDGDDDDDDDDLEAWRAQRGSYNSSVTSPHSHIGPPSPSSESIFHPNGRPPSHGYVDPTYYGEDIPPVPPVPAQYASSLSSTSRGTTPPDSARMRASRRELPSPPTPSSESRHPMHRSQSTPPREVSAISPGRRPSEPIFLATSSSSVPAPVPPLPPARSLSRSQSMNKMRQLPRPPTEDLQRSSSRSTRRGSQYSQRSLPMPPGSATSQTPPPLPRPPPRKDPTDELWGYSWSSNAPGRCTRRRRRTSSPPSRRRRRGRTPTNASRLTSCVTPRHPRRLSPHRLRPDRDPTAIRCSAHCITDPIHDPHPPKNLVHSFTM